MQRPLSKEEQDWVEGTLEAMSLRELIGQTMQDHAGRLPFRGTTRTLFAGIWHNIRWAASLSAERSFRRLRAERRITGTGP